MRIVQGDLVLLPYPFSNLEGVKVRPALVVSGNKLNRKSNDCIMIPLTSVIRNEPFSIIINQENLSSGRLIKTSRIKADRIFCVDKSLVRIKIGHLNGNSFNEVIKNVLRVFD